MKQFGLTVNRDERWFVVSFRRFVPCFHVFPVGDVFLYTMIIFIVLGRRISGKRRAVWHGT